MWANIVYFSEPIRLYEPTDQETKFIDGVLIFTICYSRITVQTKRK